MYRDYTCMTDLLKDASGVFVYDLLDCMSQIPNEYLGIIKDPPKGVYSAGGVRPLFDLSDVTLQQSGRQPVSLEEIKESGEGIVVKKSNNSVFYISALSLRNILPRLSEQPSFNINALPLILAKVKTHFQSLSKYDTVRSGGPSNYLDFIKEEYRAHEEINNNFDMALRHLFSAINNFIGEDIHHIYLIRLKGTCLFIEKFIDIRIYRFYEEIEFKDEGRSFE
jgi:hypothetical protein